MKSVPPAKATAESGPKSSAPDSSATKDLPGQPPAAIPATARPGFASIAWFGLLLVVGIYLWCIRTRSYVSDDSYFYLAIARNIALHGQQSFSNLFITNGFHPLWGYVLAGYDLAVKVVSPAALNDPTTTLPLAIALLLGTLAQTWRMARGFNFDPILVTAVVGAYSLTTGILYSEALLFMFLLATLLAMYARNREAATTHPVWFGLVSGAIVLARLDAVFLIGLLLLDQLWRSQNRTRVIVACGVCALVVGAYVASNLVYFGGAMPISGWMKGSFPVVFLKGLSWNGLQSSLGGYSVVFGWAPIVLTAGLLLISRRAPADQRWLLLIMFAGAIAHAAYVALFTRSHTMWPWYYVQTVFLAATALAILVEIVMPRIARPVMLFLISAFIIAGYIDKLDENRAPSNPVVEYLRKNNIHGETILVSDWPGAVAFYTDNNVLAADMLTLNRRLFEKMRATPNALEFLLTECRERGKPLREIIFVSNSWLTWDDDSQSITYNDPRRYPTLVPIGKLAAHRNPAGELVCDRDVRIWFAPHHDGADENPDVPTKSETDKKSAG